MTSVLILQAQQGARDERNAKSQRLLNEADRVNREAHEVAIRLRRIAEIYRDRLDNQRVTE